MRWYLICIADILPDILAGKGMPIEFGEKGDGVGGPPPMPPIDPWIGIPET